MKPELTLIRKKVSELALNEQFFVLQQHEAKDHWLNGVPIGDGHWLSNDVNVYVVKPEQ